MGTAAVLGLCAGGGEVRPNTAYLMLGETCIRKCAFCAQAADSTAGAGRLSRVTWPVFELGELLPKLAAACAAGRFARVCVQTVVAPDAPARLLGLIAELRSAVSTPISASVYTRKMSGLRELFSAGLNRVGLALDAASAEIYREVKGGDLAAARAFVEEAGSAFPGRVSTHLIVGLGESERDVLALAQWCADRDITAGLFAFTPVRGTRLAGRRPPDLDAYRRIQAASYLIGRRKLRFDRLEFAGGRLAGIGLERRDLVGLLSSGEAFRTAGCPGCNRPYYNERPGKVPYNYPRPLTGAEARAALGRLLRSVQCGGGATETGADGGAATAGARVSGGGRG